MTFALHRIGESDWREFRDIRLRALADTPNGFLETLLHAVAETEVNWRFRASRFTGPDSIGLAAVDGRQWVGTMRGLLVDGRAMLVGVFVLPSHRGRAAGVADLLLDGIAGWATGLGHRELFLQVHSDNVRAHRFYARRGFALTGVRAPYPLVRGEVEYEMRATLPLAGAWTVGQPAQ